MLHERLLLAEPDDSISTPSFSFGAACQQCGYRLAGLPEMGTCPECGIEYDPTTVLPQPKPSSVRVAGLLFWPLLLLLCGVAWSSFFGGMALLVVAPLASIAGALNTPMVVSRLSRNHLPTSQRSRSMFQNASRFGVAALLLTIANTIVAVVGIIVTLLAGACLVLLSP